MRRYLGEIIGKCTAFIASTTSPASRKEALNSLNRQVNYVVMIEHFYLDQMRLVHCMDSYSRLFIKLKHKVRYLVPCHLENITRTPWNQSMLSLVQLIYDIRLIHDSPGSNKSILALRAGSISNDLCGSDTMSSFEISNGFTKPLLPNSAPVIISTELVNTRGTIIVKRDLNLMMRSKAT